MPLVSYVGAVRAARHCFSASDPYIRASVETYGRSQKGR
jgi:hypothetical protein